jgi:hypothetical protein
LPRPAGAHKVSLTKRYFILNLQVIVMPPLASSSPNDSSLKAAVSTLFTEQNRRLLGAILTDGVTPQSTTPVKETFPLALQSVLQSVDSQGQGSKAYESLRRNIPLVFATLVNAEPKHLATTAKAVVSAHTFADQPNRDVVEAAFRRAGTQSTTPTITLPKHPLFAPTHFSVPELIGNA